MKKLLLLLLMFMCVSSTSGNKIDRYYVEPISKETLWQFIKESEIKYPELVFAQAILESGHFTSKVFKINNNLFGMKIPKFRETIAIGKSKKGYAIYNHWTQSVQDYAIFQEYIMSKGYDTKQEYIAYLNKTYSESSGYVNKLKGIINKHKYILV